MPLGRTTAMLRRRAVRFVIVGVLSLAADTGALFVLHGVARIWLPLATGLAYVLAFGVNFGLNRAWVFDNSASLAPQLGKYLLLVLANLGSTVILVPTLAAAGLPYLIAKLITAAGLAVINFFISRHWIFPARQPVPAAHP